MLPDAAVESTGALAGKFEVLGSIYKVHKDKEYELKPGQTPRDNPKVVALSLKVTPCGDDGERLEDADTRDITLKLGGKSLATFHPGKGTGPDDTDPDDLGDELNTEGNTLFISGGEVAMNAKSGYTVFMKSLQHKGFPKEKIAECWAPSFKGLKFELATVTPDKLEAYGQKKGDANQDGQAITYKVVQSIISLPGGKKAKKSTEEAATAPVPAKKSKSAPPPADDDDDDGTMAPLSSLLAAATVTTVTTGPDAESEARRVLTAVAGKLAGKNKKLDQAKTFWVTLYSDPKIKGSAKLQQEARKFVNNDTWLTDELEELGCVIDADDKTVQFAEAA